MQQRSHSLKNCNNCNSENLEETDPSSEEWFCLDCSHIQNRDDDDTFAD